MGKLVYGNTRLVTIKAKPIISLILHSYADDDKKKILNITANKPRIILDIINACKLPQTSSYRKINSLIKNGLLIPDGQISRKFGKKVTKYVALFENLEINIIKNDISVIARFSERRMPELVEPIERRAFLDQGLDELIISCARRVYESVDVLE